MASVLFTNLLRRAAPLLLVGAALSACSPTAPPPGAEKRFVGSAACESCHQDIYARWKTTLVANVVQDPSARPEAILGDFSTHRTRS